MANRCMFKIDTTSRSTESEIMDNFDLKGKELKRTLKDLNRINSWLGGNRVTLQGVKKLLNGNKSRNIRIVDIGCGNGAMLRKLSGWGKRNGYLFELTGIDANPHAIKIAMQQSEQYPDIKYQTLNIFSSEFREMEFDIILCTLTLHHFKDEEIINLLRQFTDQSNQGVVINDLHRTRTAYILFKAFCAFFVHNSIARKDGLISILRGFKKRDLLRYQQHIPVNKHGLYWKWAFRYLWVIEKNRDIYER